MPDEIQQPILITNGDYDYTKDLVVPPEAEELLSKQEPDWLVDMKTDLDQALTEGSRNSYKTGRLSTLDDEEWHVVLINNELVIIDGYPVFKGRGSASQRLRSIINSMQHKVLTTVRMRMGYQANLAWNDPKHWTVQQEDKAQEIADEHKKMWKEDYAQVLSLKEYREKFGDKAEI